MFTTDAIALASPSGRISKRALKAAQERIRLELFGPNGLQQEPVPQPSERERDLRVAAELRQLASHGVKPRTYMREAIALEAKWK